MSHSSTGVDPLDDPRVSDEEKRLRRWYRGRASVPLRINPAVRPGLDALSLWLEQAHYSQHAREAILAHTAREGCPTGSSYLEAEDEAGATGAYLRALPAVPYDDPAWDRDQGVLFDAELLATNSHPWPIPTVGDDDRTEDLAAAALEDLGIPPISGGAPTEDDERWWAQELDSGPLPSVPTAADLAEMHAHRDATECLYGYE